MEKENKRSVVSIVSYTCIMSLVSMYPNRAVSLHFLYHGGGIQVTESGCVGHTVSDGKQTDSREWLGNNLWYKEGKNMKVIHG